MWVVSLTPPGPAQLRNDRGIRAAELGDGILASILTSYVPDCNLNNVSLKLAAGGRDEHRMILGERSMANKIII